MYPRTLEVLRPLGVTDALLAAANIVPEAHLHLGLKVTRVRLADFALDDTAFPHLSLLRQMDLEAVLVQALEDRGIEVERGTELVGVGDGAEGACAMLRSPAGCEQVLCGFVAGCDGAASTVRASAGIGWDGGTYPNEIVLADAELDGDLAPGVAHVASGAGGLLFAFALGERASWRLLATQPVRGGALPSGQPGPPVPVAELQALLNASGLGASIARLAWSERIRVQHRVADRFREGRRYLAGDAAHVYSPAAGQGMNTGIQDAMNLGWKLAFATSGTAAPALLESYERERRPVARRRLALTHLTFWAEASTGLLPSLLRTRLAPVGARALPAVMNCRRPVAEGVRLLSHMRVNYRGSPLSVEGTPCPSGQPKAGDRLPDASVTCGDRSVRLHALLSRPGVHILLHRDADDVGPTALGSNVTVRRLTSEPGTAVLAVRPDGYVGFRCGVMDGSQLRAWLALLGLRPSSLDPVAPAGRHPGPGRQG